MSEEGGNGLRLARRELISRPQKMYKVYSKPPYLQSARMHVVCLFSHPQTKRPNTALAKPANPKKKKKTEQAQSHAEHSQKPESQQKRSNKG